MEDKITVLFTITPYSKKPLLEKIFTQNNLPLNLIFHGEGTATSDLMEMFGLEETKRLVSVSFVRQKTIHEIYGILNRKLNLDKKGSGIGFTLPISCISGFLPSMIKEYEGSKEQESEGQFMTNAYELIVTIVSNGYYDRVMDAAKSVGAKGGTVIHAKGLGASEVVKFLGITIQPEKDLVLILTDKSKKSLMMEKIAEQAGICTEGKGISFAVPITSVLGLTVEDSFLEMNGAK